MDARSRMLSLPTIVLGVVIPALVAINCADDGHDDGIASDDCRLDPQTCEGGAGGLCHSDDDCAPELHCCEDNDNCGDGMCTASCNDDGDCPEGMLCEHDLCFYACHSDADCADTMSCEHDNTICEYP